MNIQVVKDEKRFKKEIYPSYKKDFPAAQRVPYSFLKRYREDNTIKVLVLENKDQWLGYCMVVEEKEYVLVYYIAILEKYRNLGYGSKFLDLLKKVYQKEKAIFLEVERQGYGKNEEENELRRRRTQFYMRNGFKETNVVARIWSTDYEIFAYCFQEIEKPDLAKQVWEAEEAIYQRFFSKSVVEKKVKLEFKASIY